MRRTISIPSLPILVSLALLLGVTTGRSQWITQNNSLKAGWNSVYLHVDASHTNANSLLLAVPAIQEVWLWTQNLPPGLSLATPPDPSPSSQWIKWSQVDGINSALKTLPGNAALLVRVADGTAPFTWSIKGRPVAPSYRWTLTGLNFVGFPTTTPGTNFEAFLAPDAQLLEWKQSAEIFRYQGGSLGATNPILVSSLLQRAVPVVREQAYWIRTGEPTNQIYNRYFGPFQVSGGGASGIDFGEAQGQTRLYLKNMTESNLTVTLREVASETPPTGPVQPLLPLMVRGPVNTTNLTFGYSNLTAGPASWTLAPYGQPGSQVEIILGVDRAKIWEMGSYPADTVFAGVLQFTDALGFLRVNIGASAITPSRDGLWVGSALVTSVDRYLKNYVRPSDANDFHARLNRLPGGEATAGINTAGTNVLNWAVSADGTRRYEWDTNSGLVLVFGTNTAAGKVLTGSYLQDGAISTPSEEVVSPAELRLIVHNSGNTARLLQSAYLGENNSGQLIVSARQSALDQTRLATARRISAVHLPATPGSGPWPFNGSLQAASMSATVTVAFDDHGSNPFLHTYHPDHDNRDNRDDTFQTTLPSGWESYDIRRAMGLSFGATSDDFDSRTRSNVGVKGTYTETISIRTNNVALRQFNVIGSFTLTRVSDAATFVP